MSLGIVGIPVPGTPFYIEVAVSVLASSKIMSTFSNLNIVSKYKRLNIILLFKNGTLSICRRFLVNSNIQIDNRIKGIFSRRTLFPAVLTTLATCSPN